MWSEVSQIRQPHDGVLETNKQVEQNEFEQQRQHYLRAKKAGLVAKQILETTGFYVADEEVKGHPHTMIGNPVDISQFAVASDETGLHSFARAYVAFDKEEHREIHIGKLFSKKSLYYTPDFEKVSKVGIIYLAGPAGGELVHESSVHWTHADSQPIESVVAIEEGLEAIQNAIAAQPINQNLRAS